MKPTFKYSSKQEQWEIVIPIAPVPASRARIGKWGTYYPRTYATWMLEVRDMLAPFKAKPTDEDIYLSCTHVCRKPKTSKLGRPHGDFDNYLKGSVDAVTKAQLIWEDDKQVVWNVNAKRFVIGDEHPHVHIRAGLTLGVLWLAEPTLTGFDVYDL